MRFLKLIVIISLFFSFFKVNAGYYYPYLCNSSNCYETEFGILDTSDSGYFLINTEKEYISNFGDYLDEQIEEYIDYYGTETFETTGIYYGTGEIVTESFTLEELLSIEDEFYGAHEEDGEIQIENTFDDGYDFLYRFFSDIIDELHDGFPSGDKKDDLDDLLENILSYNSSNNKFLVKNVCDGFFCHNSEKLNIKYDSTDSYRFLTGDIQSYNNFIDDTFVVSEDYSISSLSLNAGDSLTFDFGFEDYLDVSSTYTEYEYTISYNYEGEALETLFNERIKIKNDFSYSSETISDDVLDTMIDLDVLSNTYKKIRVGINEGLTLTKVGEVYFYLSVTNINTGDEFETTKISESPVYVSPNNEVTGGDASIYGFTDELNDAGFNIGDTFTVVMTLEDEYGNPHYDTIGGYEISLADGSSDAIELGYYGTDSYSDTLVGVESTVADSYPIYFKFRITEAGYHDLNGFDIKIRKKSDSDSYIYPADYVYYDDLEVSTLINDEGQQQKIYIKSALESDFDITCTNTDITLTAECQSDNFSGCNPSANNSITLTAADNGTSGTLTISDYAHNVKNLNYSMNHIDNIAPTAKIYKGLTEITSSTYKHKADSDDLRMSFSETTTSSCTSSIDYSVYMNDSLVATSVFLGSNSEYIIYDFFETAGTYELKIVLKDNYGNTNTENYTIYVYPDDLDTSNSGVTFTTDNIIANNSAYFVGTVSLKDQFGNNIYGKRIYSLDQDCGTVTGCNTLMSDMSDEFNPSGDDVLYTSNYSSNTNSSGEKTFILKSLVPGEFTNRFSFSLEDWGNNYSGLGTYTDYVLYDAGDEYSFISPIEGFISINGSGYPELSKSQEYEISLDNIGGLSGYTNGNLDINEDSIDITANGHFWREFELDNKYFNDDLDTKLTFSGSIDASDSALSSITLNTSDLVINYNIVGKDIYYKLDNFGTYGCDIGTVGVKVIGIVQGDGKSESTGQEENFSNILKSGLRNTIRKNAYNLVTGLNSGDISNNIKYIENQDITIGGEITDYETLIVKNGNVFIDSDLNTSKSKLGIIVLKDGYNINTDYNNTGNIYVGKDVSNISAVIYADGAFRSADVNGDSYSETELLDQLYLYGTLFTRNTIGGAVLLDSTYLLPGGQETTDYSLAEIYDLNYVRKTSLCGVDDYSFLIEYNPDIQLDPPKGFTQ